MLGLVKLTLPTRPLQVTEPLAAPEPVTTGSTRPSPDVDTVMFPAAAVMEPGAVKMGGIVRVTVAPEPAVVISFAVPAILTFPAEGVAVPVSPVNVRNEEEPDSKRVHVGVVTPADVEMEVRK